MVDPLKQTPDVELDRDNWVNKIGRVRRDRGTTHGDFRDGAKFVQTVMRAAQAAPNWTGLSDVERECLHHIFQKIQRLVCGSSHLDHWVDIAGYAGIAADDMEKK